MFDGTFGKYNCITTFDRVHNRGRHLSIVLLFIVYGEHVFDEKELFVVAVFTTSFLDDRQNNTKNRLHY